MSEKQVNIIKISSDTGTEITLDPHKKIDKIRSILIEKKLMTQSGSFLVDGSPLLKRHEGAVSLRELLKNGNRLIIGDERWGACDAKHAGKAWEELSVQDRNELFEKIGLRRGLILHEYSSVGRSFQNCAQWDSSVLSTRDPVNLLETVSDCMFTEINRDLATIGIKSKSIPFLSQWSGSRSEYQYQKDISDKSGSITAFLLGKHIINKVTINLEPGRMKPTPEFMKIIKTAILNSTDSIKGYSDLIKVLNVYGYYVAAQVTLGGALLRHSEAKIEDYSDAASKKVDFFLRLNSALNDIRKSIASSDHRFQQMGGISGSNNHYGKWLKSLESASNWVITSYEKIIPTIALIGREDMAVGNICYHLLRKFATYNEVKKLQTVINMGQYAGQAKAYYKNPI